MSTQTGIGMKWVAIMKHKEIEIIQQFQVEGHMIQTRNSISLEKNFYILESTQYLEGILYKTLLN